MGTNRPKLELKIGEERTVTLLKDEPVTGENSYGAFWMYNLAMPDGTEVAFFAPAEVHRYIHEHQLSKGSRFTLRRNTPRNGTKPIYEIVLPCEPAPTVDDGLKATLLQSLLDAREVVTQAGLQVSNEEVQKLAITLFIQRTRL